MGFCPTLFWWKKLLRFIANVFNFYLEGFKNLKLGKTLWKIIIIKLFVMFVVLKLFIFDSNFNTIFKSDQEKSEFVLKNITPQ